MRRSSSWWYSDEETAGVGVRRDFPAPHGAPYDDLAACVPVLPEPLQGAGGLLGSEGGGDEGRGDRRLCRQGRVDLVVQGRQIASQGAGVPGLPVVVTRRVEDVGEQAADIAPAPVDRGAVHARTGRDGVHSELVVPVFHEFGADRVEHSRADACGTAAGAAAGRRLRLAVSRRWNRGRLRRKSGCRAG